MTEPLFVGLVGQGQATGLLLAALEQQRLAPAYLFCGPDGVGRSIAARRFLEGVIAGPGGSASVRRRLQEGNHPDLLWVEPTYSEKGQLVPASQAAAPVRRLPGGRSPVRSGTRCAMERNDW